MSNVGQRDGQPRESGRFSHQYWNRSLGAYYSDWSHRLVIYLMLGAAYLMGTFFIGFVFYGPAWLFSDIAHITANALNVALVFGGSLMVVDLAASRLDQKRLAYDQRRVGRQWLVMLAGFILAYALFQAVFHDVTEFYGSWLFGYDQNSSGKPLQFMPGFLFFLLVWLLSSLVIIQFALWSQNKARASASHPGSVRREGQDSPGDGFLVLSHQNHNLQIPFAEITHVTVEDHYCRLYQIKGKEIASQLIRMPLKRLEDQLPRETFVRIHRSHIVNLQHVLGWRMVRGQRRMVMDHGLDELPVSRHRSGQIEPIIKSLKRREPGPGQTPALGGDSSS